MNLIGCVMVATLSVSPFVQVENTTGQNLPDLVPQVCLALEHLAARAPGGRPFPVRVRITSFSGSDQVSDTQRETLAGQRYLQPRGFVDRYMTLTIEGDIMRLGPDGAEVLESMPFRGRASDRLDYEPWLATNQARRTHGGFQPGRGRLDPFGLLVSQAMFNAWTIQGVERWLCPGAQP